MTNDVKVLKLITGEEIITRITEGGVGLIILDKPMILAHAANGKIILIPWMRASKTLAESEKVTISSECILVEDVPLKDIEKNYLSTVTGLTL